MNSQEFNEIVKQTERLVEKTLIKKQDEYNLDEDRLSFFKHNAQFLGKTPEEALWAMASKHFISLTDMINSKQAFAEETLALVKDFLSDIKQLKKVIDNA